VEDGELRIFRMRRVRSDYQVDGVWIFAQKLAKFRGDALNDRVDGINMTICRLNGVAGKQVK